jgi:hypothetical protein
MLSYEAQKSKKKKILFIWQSRFLETIITKYLLFLKRERDANL